MEVIQFPHIFSVIIFIVCVRWRRPMLWSSSWVTIPTASASLGERQVRIRSLDGRPGSGPGPTLAYAPLKAQLRLPQVHSLQKYE